MENLKELVARAERTLAEMEDLRSQDATDEQLKAKAAEFDAVQGRIETVQADLRRRQSLAEAKRELEVDVTGKSLRDPAQPRDGNAEARERELGFWDYIQGKALPDRMREALRPRSPSFKQAADGVVMPDALARRIFGKQVAEAMGKALPMTAGSQGANLIPQDFRALLLDLAPEPPSILQRATVVPAPYGSVQWPVLAQTDADEFGGITGDWIEEGGEKPDTEAAISQLKISTYEYAAYTEVTNRLLSRSPVQLEALLTRLFRDKVSDALDTAFLVGSGIGQPEGVVTNVQIRLVGRDAAGTINYTDLVNLEHAVRAYHRARAIWVVQDAGVRALKLQTDTTGRPLFVPALAGGIPDRLLGYPHIDTHRLPALGSRGDIVLGDWSQYIVAMEEEVVVQRSEHYKFKNNVTAFRVSVVVGGKVAEPRAFAILDNVVGSTTQGNAGSTTTSA